MRAVWRTINKSAMFYPHYDTALMWGCQSRKACGTSLQKQLHVYIRSMRGERIWKLLYGRWTHTSNRC